jgi:hypothetical protein
VEVRVFSTAPKEPGFGRVFSFLAPSDLEAPLQSANTLSPQKQIDFRSHLEHKQNNKGV